MFPLMRAACLMSLLLWSGASLGQEFPSRPIRFIVPFPAGGPSDVISRVLVEKMSGLLGQTVVIENRAGAAGLNGIAAVAKSEPNGYTIAIAPSSSLAINVSLRDDMPFAPLKDLALITQIVSVPEILVVNESVPAHTLPELVALARSQPGKLTFASTGLGGMPHMAMELLKLAAGLDIVHVPYTGAAPAVNDLLGDHVQMMFADVPCCWARFSPTSCARWRSAAVRVWPLCPRWRPLPSSGLPRSRPTTGTDWWRPRRRRSRSLPGSIPRRPRPCIRLK
jgi:tripartite-type tricarboxylate transporter receptor subunit TctC